MILDLSMYMDVEGIVWLNIIYKHAFNAFFINHVKALIENEFQSQV